MQDQGVGHLLSNVQSTLDHDKSIESSSKVTNAKNNIQVVDNLFDFSDLQNVCKLTFQDSLISATTNIINEQLGFVKIDDDEIISVIETINCNEINDW